MRPALGDPLTRLSLLLRLARSIHLPSLWDLVVLVTRLCGFHVRWGRITRAPWHSYHQGCVCTLCSIDGARHSRGRLGSVISAGRSQRPSLAKGPRFPNWCSRTTVI